jgi:hypothetical protein
VIAARYPAKLHGLGITGPDDVSSLPLTTASSTSWISPTKYGDTHIWAGGRFHWYPKRSSDDARRRHTLDVEQAGFDPEAYAAGDRKEVARYTIWAWKQYEAHMSELRGTGMGQVVAINGSVGTTGNRQNEGGSVGTTDGESSSRQLVVRRERTQVFPGLSFRSEELEPAGQNDETPARTVNVPAVADTGLRACSSCYLAKRCPAFDPESTCAYKFPLEIRTRPQLMASLQGLLEMQYSRVIFARAAEEMDGSVINADTSSAIKDYMKMVEMMKNIESDPSFLRVEAKGPAAQGLVSMLVAAATQNRDGEGQAIRVPAQQVDPERAEAFIRAQTYDVQED